MTEEEIREWCDLALEKSSVKSELADTRSVIFVKGGGVWWLEYIQDGVYLTNYDSSNSPKLYQWRIPNYGLYIQLNLIGIIPTKYPFNQPDAIPDFEWPGHIS